MEKTTESQDLTTKASQRVAERLVWFTARKDQASIAHGIADGKDLDEVYGLGEAALFDELFCFLDEFKLSSLFAKLEPKTGKRGSNVSFHAVLLIYLMRIVCGLKFFWNIKSVILQSQPLMRIVGFNGRQVRVGTSARGMKKQTVRSQEVDAIEPEKSQDEDDKIPIRGPLGPQSIGKYVSAILASALERFFNGVIRILAARSFFPKRVHALLNASEIQTTEKCKGCGKVKKEKAPELRRRKGRIRKVLEVVFGFKIWVVWEANSKLPLAMRFATINVADIDLAQEVVAQAMANLGEHATIKSLAFDCGFLDGKFMWWLDQNNIVFQIPVRKECAQAQGNQKKDHQRRHPGKIHGGHRIAPPHPTADRQPDTVSHQRKPTQNR